MKQFKILTLGASGAGKTVFLASMFKALSIQKNSSFKLDIEDSQQRKLLNSIYTQIITGDTWPPGTKDVSEWTFTCQVQTEELDKYNACQFTYFDYAGGRLTDLEEDRDFEKVVQQADVALGLLDGHKISAWLDGSDKQRADIFLSTDLPSILKRMQNLTVPVHFVISKWDILDGSFTLSQIREKLSTIPAFAELVKKRGQAGSIVRIIPVSAIGLEFATMQPDGSMKKNPGKSPIPFLVEVPMSCVLPDRLQQLFNERQEREEQLKQEIQNREGRDSIASILATNSDYLGIGSIVFELLFDLDDGAKKLIKIISFVLTGGSKTIAQFTKASRRKREATLKSVQNEQTALMHAINVFYDFEQELLEIFPDSKLV